MRIVGGKWRGKKLAQFSGRVVSPRLRPTMDKVRETLFNILAHGVIFDVKGAQVLDLFCGTGALGFEALSRGAKHACFIDNDKTSLGLVAENKLMLKLGNEIKILRKDATKLKKNIGSSYNLIFLDPPYGHGFGNLAINVAFESGWISEDAMIVWEEKSKVFPPKELKLITSRTIGNSCLNFLKRVD